jgi:hypothetical protein
MLQLHPLWLLPLQLSLQGSAKLISTLVTSSIHLLIRIYLLCPDTVTVGRNKSLTVPSSWDLQTNGDACLYKDYWGRTPWDV